jgi:hypothetical protein
VGRAKGRTGDDGSRLSGRSHDQQRQGCGQRKIASWDVVLFEPTGTPPAGAIRVYGTQHQIEEYIRSDEFVDPIEKAQLCVNNVGYRRFVTGAALAEGLGTFAERINSL